MELAQQWTRQDAVQVNAFLYQIGWQYYGNCIHHVAGLTSSIRRGRVLVILAQDNNDVLEEQLRSPAGLNPQNVSDCECNI